jgi:hypothetical protein
LIIVKNIEVGGSEDETDQRDIKLGKSPADEIKTVERQVDVIREEQTKTFVQEEVPVHPEFQNWQNRNPWYGSVKYMREFADEVGGRLANTMSPSDVLKEVEKAVRKEFPQKSDRKGAVSYGVLRALQLRRFRIPPPRLKAGGKPVTPKIKK